MKMEWRIISGENFRINKKGIVKCSHSLIYLFKTQKSLHLFFFVSDFFWQSAWNNVNLCIDDFC